MSAEVFDFLAARAARNPIQLAPEQVVAIHIERALLDLPSERVALAKARAARNLSIMPMEEAKRRAIAWARSAIEIGSAASVS